MNQTVETLYYAAIDAEREFSKKLKEAYGLHGCEMRYRSREWRHAGLWHAADNARAANDAYRAAVRQMRGAC